MVFSEDYDKSLWLMICGDSFNRDEITFVIKNISFELLEQIQNTIIQYNIDNVSKNINYKRCNLSYVVNIDCSGLSIKMIIGTEIEKEEIEIFLLPYNDHMKLNETICLGGFTNTTYYDCMKFGTTLDEYEMVRTIFGSYVKLYIDNGVRCINKTKVSIKKIPDNFSVHQLRTDKSIKRLIRGKK